MSWLRYSAIALILVLTPSATALRAQTRGPDWTEKLRAELKASVDRQLALKVRELRRELHEAIDEAIAKAAGPDLDEVLAEIEGKSPLQAERKPAAVVSVPATPSLQQLAQRERESYDRLLGLARQFSELLGPDHPRTLQVADELRWHPARTDLTPGQLLGIECRSQFGQLPAIQPIAGGLAANSGLEGKGRLLALGQHTFKAGAGEDELLSAMNEAVRELRAERAVTLRVQLGEEEGRAIQRLQLQRKQSAALSQPPSVREVLDTLIRTTVPTESIQR